MYMKLNCKCFYLVFVKVQNRLGLQEIYVNRKQNGRRVLHGYSTMRCIKSYTCYSLLFIYILYFIYSYKANFHSMV